MKEDIIKEKWVNLVGYENFDKLKLDENGWCNWQCRKLMPQSFFENLQSKLRPFKAKLTLKEISEVGETFLVRTGHKPFFNYCANAHNSSPFDADKIAELFNPDVFEATISVVCERDESISAANQRQRNLASIFMGYLNEHGFSTRMFDPAGQDDIGGGCGQLWFVQEWMKNNPDKAKKSIGFGMESVHTPL